MKTRIGKIIIFALIALIILCAGLLLADIAAEPASAGAPGSGAVSLSGQYSVNGGGFWRFPGDMRLENGIYDVVFTGGFSRDIEKNEVLNVFCSNVRYKLYINGELCMDEGGPRAAFSKTGGSYWAYFTSPGISINDEICIEMTNIYPRMSTRAFESVLLNMGTGSFAYSSMMKESFKDVILSTFIMLLGLLLLIISFSIGLKGDSFLGTAISASFFAVAGGLYYLYDANFEYMSLIMPYPLFNTILDILAIFLMAVFLTAFLRTFVTGVRRTVMAAASIVFAGVTAAACIIQIFGPLDIYELQPVGVLMHSAALAGSLIILMAEYYIKRKKEVLFEILSFIPLTLGSIAAYFDYVFVFYDNRLWYHIGFLITVLIQFIHIIKIFKEKALAAGKAEQLERELLESKVTVMLSQIKPHFLFNSLNAIGTLCLSDPAAADEAIVHFSDYLRTNLNSIDAKVMVTFMGELEHIKNYVSLEKMRYGDGLCFKYDIAHTDFMVPTLSLQPIVENAIRHGVSKKKGGGTVTLSTRRTDKGVVVCVTDDGIGFDAGEPARVGSIGLQNVRQRLAMNCDATLTIDSEPGAGTRVTIFLPHNTRRSFDELR